MTQLRTIDSEAADWLLSPERPKEMWARHTIDSRCNSDHITNNVTESFNYWVGVDRKKSIMVMVESLTCRIMGRLQRRFEKGSRFEFVTTPRIRKIVDMTMQDAKLCKVIDARDDEFQGDGNVEGHLGDANANEIPTQSSISNGTSSQQLPCTITTQPSQTMLTTGSQLEPQAKQKKIQPRRATQQGPA
ncbi:hypothetical protein Cni_G28761 [Canna indica]|uniref:Uncharacterized protein n=1 Tax=Canna indica TaxID=4628 RepID=A0AAQ3L411_9LILI|nr:hypothetical protein Cni_G28761 [Canna indica]